MCNKHLLGEHVEMHMFVGAINKGKNIDGFVTSGFVNTSYIEERHHELVREMEKRGMAHKSPLPMFKDPVRGHVFSEDSLKELLDRCSSCKIRFKEFHK